jgi:hypothetical protein
MKCSAVHRLCVFVLENSLMTVYILSYSKKYDVNSPTFSNQNHSKSLQVGINFAQLVFFQYVYA